MSPIPRDLTARISARDPSSRPNHPDCSPSIRSLMFKLPQSVSAEFHRQPWLRPEATGSCIYPRCLAVAFAQVPETGQTLTSVSPSTRCTHGAIKLHGQTLCVADDSDVPDVTGVLVNELIAAANTYSAPERGIVREERVHRVAMRVDVDTAAPDQHSVATEIS